MHVLINGLSLLVIMLLFGRCWECPHQQADDVLCAPYLPTLILQGQGSLHGGSDVEAVSRRNGLDGLDPTHWTGHHTVYGVLSLSPYQEPQELQSTALSI